MIGLEEAQARLLSLANERLVSIEHVALIEAHGRFAAADIYARRNQPDADLSAMDGYAISASHLAGPWTVIGESAAGNPFAGSCTPADAVRIFTGAVLPGGANTVVMQEDVARVGNVMSLLPGMTLRPGQHVRKRASDFEQDALLVSEGSGISAAQIGLIAAAGHAVVPVRAPVAVTIISTGDELVAPGEPTEIDQIPASNDVMLSALLARPGVSIRSSGIVPDRKEAIAKALEDAADADIIITIGGASVGDHDLVRPALLEAGAEIDFWKVAMKPGKPLMAGRLDHSLVLGLPGNPVSAYVTALLFAGPVLEALRGNPVPLPRRQAACLGEDLPANGSRTDFIRAQWLNGQVVPVGRNDSAALTALSRADCLIVRPAYASAAKAGESAEILELP